MLTSKQLACKFANECPYHCWSCDLSIPKSRREECVDFLTTKVEELEYHISELEGKIMDNT